MLIIFDLDDTLIDTSGAITPHQLKKALHQLMERGDFASAYQELLALDREAGSSKEAVSLFAAKYSFDRLEEALEALKSPLEPNFVVPTTPNAKEVLEFLQKTHRLALVTAGSPRFQAEKLEKAGIDRSIFSKIAVPEDSMKKPFYEGLLREFSIPPQDVWVCGDRIQTDLVPAFELGMNTVHMRWGRGSRMRRETWLSGSIATLDELKGILK